MKKSDGSVPAWRRSSRPLGDLDIPCRPCGRGGGNLETPDGAPGARSERAISWRRAAEPTVAKRKAKTPAAPEARRGQVGARDWPGAIFRRAATIRRCGDGGAESPTIRNPLVNPRLPPPSSPARPTSGSRCSAGKTLMTLITHGKLIGSSAHQRRSSPSHHLQHHSLTARSRRPPPRTTTASVWSTREAWRRYAQCRYTLQILI